MFELKLSFVEDDQQRQFHDFIYTYMPENFPQVKYSVKEDIIDLGLRYKVITDKLYSVFDLGFFWGLYRMSHKSETTTRPILKLVKKIK